MVQNQVTALGCNHRNGAFRQARPLAEGQKSADVKHDFTIPPPPPTKTVGGGGRISREICRFFAFRAIIWRRGSNFPRKNAGSGVFAPSFGGGGPPVGSATR